MGKAMINDLDSQVMTLMKSLWWVSNYIRKNFGCLLKRARDLHKKRIQNERHLGHLQKNSKSWETMRNL